MVVVISDIGELLLQFFRSVVHQDRIHDTFKHLFVIVIIAKSHAVFLIDVFHLHESFDGFSFVDSAFVDFNQIKVSQPN